MAKKVMAIWAHPGELRDCDGSWQDKFSSMFSTLAQAGISIYYPFLSSKEGAFFQNSLLPVEMDILGTLLEAAHKYNVEVHPIIGFGKLVGAAPQWTYQATVPQSKQERMRSTLQVPCPSWKQNRDMLVQLIDELLARYDVDGIHLDFFRYVNMCFQDPFPCECSACGSRRELWLGHGNLTVDDKQNAAVMYQEIRQKNDVIYEVLCRIRETTQKHDARLSLAARARYLEDAVYEGQDWGRFVKDGLLDVICPMSYNDCPQRFERFLDEHVHLTKNCDVVYLPGIGKKSSLSDLTTQEFMDQIAMADAKGSDGVCIYSTRGMTNADYEALRKLAETGGLKGAGRKELIEKNV